jgi:hypothetical protein
MGRRLFGFVHFRADAFPHWKHPHFYAVSGERACLDDAIRAADWICAHRALSKGAFGAVDLLMK